MTKNIDDITSDVIGVAMSIHRELGPGLLESVYETILAAKLAGMGYKVDRQKPIDIKYEDLRFEAAFRIDILVDDRLIVEIKSVEQINKAHAKQLLTYLRLAQQPVGLLLNFNHETMKEGVRRLVNNHRDSASFAPLREQLSDI
ncbi:GxxExxY protein [Sphingobium sp. DEHP117]|uniref:GxxExxY protein n=1 Tax=Sphingobium sp. DEHP117 TaxID=2993436 RepID=UPI0027D7452D|nr:GxxExxY protein [Sphingobium sp. DEHP117]MDQ4419387.1 GxxExxY protein [Sphingobium sp. DEHP117]